MSSGPREAGNAPPRRDAADGGADLTTARGEARNGLGALQNLAQLLSGMSVGPRALGRALPEVKQGCETLRGSLALLGRGLGPAFGSGEGAFVALCDRAVAAVAGLEPLLDRAAPSSAKKRLTMEQHVRAVAAELRTALAAIDLARLVGGQPRRGPVDLRQVFSPRSGVWSDGPFLELVAGAGMEVEVEADAGVVLRLFEAIASLVAPTAAGAGLVVAVGRRLPAALVVAVGPVGTGPVDPRAPRVVVPRLVRSPELAEALRGVAERAGYPLAIGAGTAEVRFAFPSAGSAA